MGGRFFTGMVIDPEGSHPSLAKGVVRYSDQSNTENCFLTVEKTSKPCEYYRLSVLDRYLLEPSVTSVTTGDCSWSGSTEPG